MKKYIIIISVAIAVCVGIFFFFHVPKQSCSTPRDPSGMPSTVCAPTRQSPYQRMYLLLHQYFYPKDSCLVSIETGNVDCRPFFTTGYNQSATTTDLSALALSRPPMTATSPNAIDTKASSEVVWKTYTNGELGISFTYPTGKNSDDKYWGIGPGTAGKAFQATIGLPSGTAIYAYATTKDYSVEKGGPNVSTEGFAVVDGEYHIVSRGNPVSTVFVPDEVWKLSDGSSVPVVHGKNYDPSLDYPDPSMRAMVNIQNANFTGIGFVLWNMNNTGSHPSASDDLATFKKIVTSIEFVK